MLHTRTSTAVERESAERGGEARDPAVVVAAGRELAYAMRTDRFVMWSSNVRAYPIVVATRMKASALDWRLTAFVPDVHGVERQVQVCASSLAAAEPLLCDELYRRELGFWAVKLGIDHLREAA